MNLLSLIGLLVGLLCVYAMAMDTPPASAPASRQAASQAAEESFDVFTEPQEREDARSMLKRFVEAGQGQAFDKRRTELARLETPTQWRDRQEQTRRRLAEFFGPFPQKTPLNPKCVGRIERPGYTIDKIIFESQPHYYVPANLYVPQAQAMPRPGVLVTCGHYPRGKTAPDNHRVALGLVLKGYVVLVYDPMGQGEREEYADVPGGPLRTGGVEEHHYIGRPSFLLGRTLSRLRVWDGIRALDYLLSRSEVDADRIGVIGNSGGGEMALLITAVDERVKVCAVAHPGGSCEETHLQGRRVGDREIFSLIAPRPCRFIVGRESREEPRHRPKMDDLLLFYKGLGAEQGRCDLVLVDGRHNMQKPKREPMYEWLNRWLGQDQQDAKEPNLQLEEPQTLWCTRSGSVIKDLPGQSAWSLNVAALKEIAPSRPAPASQKALGNTLEGLRDRVRRRLGWIPSPGKIEAQDRSSVTVPGLAVRRLLLHSEIGINLPAVLIEPQKTLPGAPIVLHVSQDGKPRDPASPSLALDLARKGFAVLSMDLRGLGETDPGRRSKTPPVRVLSDLQWDERDIPAINAACLGRTMAGMRAFDIVRGIDWLRQQPQWRDVPIALVGEGIAGFYVLAAAALDDRAGRVACRGTLAACRELVVSRFYDLHDYFWLPGMLQDFDIPDLAALCAPRPVLWLRAVDANGTALSRERLEALTAFPRAVYDRSGQAESFRLRGTASQAPVAAGEIAVFLQEGANPGR